MNRDKLKQLLIEQSQIKQDKHAIPREITININKFTKTPFIMIISGIRRSGKSTLLHQIRSNTLTESYYVNFDDERFVQFTVDDFQMLYEVLVELFDTKNKFFFDEIQNIKGWERFIRRLHDERKKIYLTGSNASMLSKELGTHLTGRHISFSLYPFSFKEFLQFKQHSYTNIQRLTTEQKSILKKLFNEYLEKGGFPEYLQTDKEEYLKTLYENILYRDIITRYNLPNERTIKEVIYFAVSNIGKEISFNTLRKLTGLTSATTIKEYFEYLENSYLTFLIPRFNPSLKKQIYYNKKIYFIDTAIAKILGFRTSNDTGRTLENLVFLQLKRENKEIFFHKEKYECDFIIRNGASIVEALQVTQNLSENKEREIQGLLEALHHYNLSQGFILTTDHEEIIVKEKKKIIVKPIWKWLLETS
ncbi:MAG: ATP-binding protein [Candidatus Thermoplasmatota archaeon]|nr:ATP-binding protein [Candidatus Thermoplasmatota archaeon]